MLAVSFAPHSELIQRQFLAPHSKPKRGANEGIGEEREEKRKGPILEEYEAAKTYDSSYCDIVENNNLLSYPYPSSRHSTCVFTTV